ncbi:MAG: PorV/PorQ family protein [bacterium]
MGKIATLVLSVSLFSSVIFGAGITGADILKVDMGVRALALGAAYTAAGNDVDVINYNPAGLAFVNSINAKGYYVKNYAGALDLELYNIAYAQPFETSFLEGTFAIAGTYRGMPTIMNPDAEDPGVAYNDILVKVAYAVNSAKLAFIPWSEAKYLSLGIAAAAVIQQIGTYNTSSVLFDLGSQFVLYDTGIKLGLALQNIGPSVKFISEASPLPLTLRVGTSYNVKVDKDNLFLLSFDYIQDFYDYARLAAGIEDNIMEVFFIRAGYNTSVDTRNASYLSAGAGMTVKLLETTLFLDYTFRLQIWNGFTGSQQSHLAGLGVKF